MMSGVEGRPEGTRGVSCGISSRPGANTKRVRRGHPRLPGAGALSRRPLLFVDSEHAASLVSRKSERNKGQGWYNTNKIRKIN